ncbi:MAG: quinone oxidoreductase [Alphaproteobacteria bacterium]|nr:quinone oxidoreductase [Alphaproteobacteria bacterium]
MTKAAVIHEKGAPDVFRWEDWPVGEPGPGEVRLRHEAIGVNYVDTYHRRGIPHPWRVPPLPCVLGLEGMGVIAETGAEAGEFAVGDRVAYASPPHGAYSQERLMPADRLVKLPDGIDAVQAAGMMLKGLTAQYLLRRTYRVQRGDTVLVHAAAGGMGLILCQWARHLGATVVGTVSTDEKAALAQANGCDHPVIHTGGDFVAKVKEVTDGEGVPVVYESIGKDTFERSLDCLRPMGVLASYGHASGPPDPVDVIELGARGSLFVTRPAIMHYMAKRADLLASAADLFDVVESGAVKIQVNHRYPLREVAEAHRAIEERRTTGSTVLLPFD